MSEIRLINADAANVNDIICFYGSECRLEDVKEWLDDQPTVDAEPVRHGRWIDGGDFVLCSSCQCTQLKEFQSYWGKATRLWVKTDYCPHCGCRMDGDAK